MREVLTIGVYGFDAESFFAALTAAKTDTLCDVRRRRGVRGAEYAFANSNRLQAELERLGIRYVHRLDLAPDMATRRQQYERDKEAQVGKRSRERLSDEFIEAYRSGCLEGFDSQAFAEELGPKSGSVAFLCVEREPHACHRFLIAERLAADLNLPLRHLLPPG